MDRFDIQYANQLGYKIKLLGLAERNNKFIVQKVSRSLKNNSITAKINGVLNNVVLEGKPIGRVEMIGEGLVKKRLFQQYHQILYQ